MFVVAMKRLVVLEGGSNPVASITAEREHNERDRVLSADEFTRVCDAAKPWLKPILLCAYYTGMREGELRLLRWDQVKPGSGFIRLKSGDTKAGEYRMVPLGNLLVELLQSITPDENSPLVFCNPLTHKAYHASSIGHGFTRACLKPGVKDAVFHDLRHTFVTNMRRAEVDMVTIMAITGHKTTAMFRRYNTVDESDLHAAIRKLQP
jgi:integrase